MYKCISCEYEQEYPMDDDTCQDCTKSISNIEVDNIAKKSSNMNWGNIWEKLNDGEKITLDEMVFIQHYSALDDNQVGCPRSDCEGMLKNRESKKGFVDSYIGCDSKKCNFYLTIKQLKSLIGGGVMHPQCPSCRCEIKPAKVQHE